MMNDKNIDDLFRDKLKDLEQAPPAYLLDTILSGAAAARRRRRVVFWRVASVAAGLLLAFVAGWQINELNRPQTQQPVVVSHTPSTDSNQNKKDVQGAATDSNQKEQTTVPDANPEQQAAVAKAEISRTADTGKNLQYAQNTSVSKKQASPDISIENRMDETARLMPVKTIDRMANHADQLADLLPQKTESSSVADQPAMTIDQQIMEQNKQQLRVQNEKRKKNQWIIGAQVSPALSVNRSSHSPQYASNMLNSSNSSPVDLGGGLSVQLKAGKRWSVQSGIYYAGLEQSSGNITNSSRSDYAMFDKGAEYFNAPVNIEASKMMMNSTAGVIEIKGIPTGMVVGTNIEDKSLATNVVVTDARFIQNFQYLEIPLYLRYTLLDARFDVELMGGVSSNVLVGNDTYMDGSTGKTLVGKTQDMQDINYSGALGLGLKYGLSKRIFLNLEPRVKYYLNSLNNNPSVSYKPYTIGVFTGISYQF